MRVYHTVASLKMHGNRPQTSHTNGVAEEISTVLNRMRQLASRLCDDAASSSQRSETNEEILALKSEIDKIAASANYTKQESPLSIANNVRANLGAHINRLEHAINNLMVSQTNRQAAESSTLESDFARETAESAKNQILKQSATAMFSQSHVLPSSVLSLLK